MADDSSFTTERWVRIMCDYSADGVWHSDGASGCAEGLPVEEALIERIRQWQAWFETYEPWEDNPAEFDIEAFSAEGLAIAKAVKAALPDWTVIYFDEAALARASRKAPRHVYEYEISLDSN
jgi:hypothetical protein